MSEPIVVVVKRDKPEPDMCCYHCGAEDAQMKRVYIVPDGDGDFRVYCAECFVGLFEQIERECLAPARVSESER